MIFYVPAYLLKAHSVALREMIKDLSPSSSSPITNDYTPASADPSQTIAFTDDTIEASSVITFFLHTISGNRLITSIEESHRVFPDDISPHDAVCEEMGLS
ncbi:hypothetical protein L198_05864 [Cryptococcus wingfieldii CBS 7118]|uniref:Uncharacterized protein n=1 Tax=Cryptococcus wingfieldii CBS 7118 TaxID=1295528 RepID=A0A1E3IRV3_9TREE|nr:hypothetical protein L198_05864 [Cryptococcus wingfieldii CBS 7118]ODN91353.1 hypothetical protein L198_05864 [Cryptococcus wingfieldii CBS 7118]